MAKKKQQTKAEKIAHEEKYLEFLKNRIDSENYRNNVTEEEYKVTLAKYEKAKFKLRMMKEF